MFASAALLTGPVTTPENSPEGHPAAARSIAAHATSAPSPSGWPGFAANSSSPTGIFTAAAGSVSSHFAGPMTATSAASPGLAASQLAMISGPTPAGSPQVMASLAGIVVGAGFRHRSRKATFAGGKKFQETPRLGAGRAGGEARGGRLARIARCKNRAKGF